MLEVIRPGWRGTERTLGHMAALTVSDARNFTLIRIATMIARRCPPRDQKCQGQAILDFVKEYIQFILDPISHDENGRTSGLELVQAPLKTLWRRAGDCDDQSTLIAALGMALGIPAAFVVIKADRNNLQEFSHVYPALLINGKWLPADSTVKRSWLGWEPPVHFGKQVWRI